MPWTWLHLVEAKQRNENEWRTRSGEAVDGRGGRRGKRARVIFSGEKERRLRDKRLTAEMQEAECAFL